MRLAVRPEGPIDRLALWLNLAPLPVPETMFGMTMSRVLMAGVKLGVFRTLAAGPATSAELAAHLKLDRDGLPHLLDSLAALGHLERRGDRYRLSRRARRWLDPGSPHYIGTFLEFNYDQWLWWSRLEEVLQTGHTFEIHDFEPDDPRWRRYITAMFELSRLAAPEVAKRVPVPSGATKLLDAAGGHGWFAASICKRHQGLKGTVFDLPGSAKIGRDILEKERMDDRVEHVAGDLFRDALGGPYDVACYFQTLRHFTPQQNQTLYRRFFDALRPGGVVAVMDYLSQPAEKSPDLGALVGLHYYLTTGGARYTVEDLERDLKDAGFTKVKRVKVLRLPFQTMCVGWKA